MKDVRYGEPIEVNTLFGAPCEALQEDHEDPCKLLGERLAKRVDTMIVEIAVDFGDKTCTKCRKGKRGKCSGPLMTPCRKSKRAVRKGLMAKVKEMRRVREANNETD